ncbi:MAG: hypothetical protein KIT22_08485 [Verrucomicrobiae bacterium]|nr:hypothetical protein [Verrucomicrobiae bacterium]
MIADDKIREIAKQAAVRNLSPEVVQRVISEATEDSEGNDALKLTIVIAPGSAGGIKGDSLLDTLVQIHRDLSAEGEERLAIVEYATEEEMANGLDQS